MTETIEEAIRNGYISWRNNLEIAVPYLLNNIITIILLPVSIICIALVTALSATLAQSMGSAGPVLTFAVLCVSSLAALAAIAALNAYFSAGAIGMSLVATIKGRTTLSDMTEYGRTRWFDVFKATILAITLLALPAALFLLPPVYAFYSKAFLPGIALIIVETAVYVVYASVICLMYTVTSTAIVADGTGVRKSISSARAYTMKNKVKIMMSVFAYMGTMYAASLTWAVITSPLGLLNLLSPGIYMMVQAGLTLLFIVIASFMLTPLYTIWLTRIYTGKGTIASRRGHSPVSRHANREQRGTQRDIYV